MGGAITIALILVIVLPVLTLIGGTIGAVLVGWLLNANGQVSHEGSELIETNY
jgi:hypothetical protein